MSVEPEGRRHSSEEWREPVRPAGLLFVCARDLQESMLPSIRSDELHPHRQPVSRDPTGTLIAGQPAWSPDDDLHPAAIRLHGAIRDLLPTDLDWGQKDLRTRQDEMVVDFE